MTRTSPDIAPRRAWMSLLAKAPADDLAARWQALVDDLGVEPDHHLLRPPEVGGVMVRGRAGAVGASFNLGEMTVTRCSVRLVTGEVGHAYVQGRDKAKARVAALVDALMQTGTARKVEAAILAPLRAEAVGRNATRAARAAATKVDFFTMVRGED